MPAWLLHVLVVLVNVVLGTLIDIVAFSFFLLLTFITPPPAPAARPMRHGTSLELNIVITLQTPQHGTGSSSTSTGSGPVQVGTPTVTATLRNLGSQTRHIAEDRPPCRPDRIRSFLATNASTRPRRRDELAGHRDSTPPLAGLERSSADVREDIPRMEDMGEAQAMGLEGAGEGLLEAGADGRAVTGANADEPGLVVRWTASIRRIYVRWTASIRRIYVRLTAGLWWTHVRWTAGIRWTHFAISLVVLGCMFLLFTGNPLYFFIA